MTGADIYMKTCKENLVTFLANWSNYKDYSK